MFDLEMHAPFDVLIACWHLRESDGTVSSVAFTTSCTLQYLKQVTNLGAVSYNNPFILHFLLPLALELPSPLGLPLGHHLLSCLPLLLLLQGFLLPLEPLQVVHQILHPHRKEDLILHHSARRTPVVHLGSAAGVSAPFFGLEQVI